MKIKIKQIHVATQNVQTKSLAVTLRNCFSYPEVPDTEVLQHPQKWLYELCGQKYFYEHRSILWTWDLKNASEKKVERLRSYYRCRR